MAHMTGVAAGLFRAYCIGPGVRLRHGLAWQYCRVAGVMPTRSPYAKPPQVLTEPFVDQDCAIGTEWEICQPELSCMQSCHQQYTVTVIVIFKWLGHFTAQAPHKYTTALSLLRAVLRSGRQLLRSAADSGRVLVTFGGGEELDGEELDGQPLLLQGTDSWRKALLRRFLANRGDTTDGLARSQATSDNYSRSRGHGSLVLPVPA